MDFFKGGRVCSFYWSVASNKSYNKGDILRHESEET